MPRIWSHSLWSHILGIKPPGCWVNGIAPVCFWLRTTWWLEGLWVDAENRLSGDKKKPSQFSLCCFSSMAKTSNSIRPSLLGRLIEMGPKSCSWASLFPYLLMALIRDWRKWCQNIRCMTRCQRLINLTKEQQEQAMAIKDVTLARIYNKSKNWGFII